MTSDNSNRVPEFLVIGAMKSGTTTLYRDLLANPAVFFSNDKEPGNLARDEVLSDEGRQAYAALYTKAEPRQICGDASTVYSKLPDFPGVPARSKHLLGSDLRIIYLVREPIARTISHHHHLLASSVIDERDINIAIDSCPELINYSRYAMQIEPWIDTFTAEQVKILRFEDYVDDRLSAQDGICRFLEIAPAPERVDIDRVFNQSEGKPVVGGIFGQIQRTSAYRTIVRPLLPIGWKDRLRALLLPPTDTKAVQPTPATIDRLAEVFDRESRRLTGIMASDEPLWKFDDARQRFGVDG